MSDIKYLAILEKYKLALNISSLFLNNFFHNINSFKPYMLIVKIDNLFDIVKIVSYLHK